MVYISIYIYVFYIYIYRYIHIHVLPFLDIHVFNNRLLDGRDPVAVHLRHRLAPSHPGAAAAAGWALCSSAGGFHGVSKAVFVGSSVGFNGISWDLLWVEPWKIRNAGSEFNRNGL